jgi:hypothetical protein
LQFRKVFGKDLPLRAKLVRTDGHLGRPPDPEHETRDKALAYFVDQRIKRGDRYKTAIHDTQDMIHKHAREDGWGGQIGKKTIRNAYDNRNNGRMPK